MMTEEIHFEQAHGRLIDSMIESPSADDLDEVWGDAETWPLGWYDAVAVRPGKAMCKEEFIDFDEDDRVVSF